MKLLAVTAMFLMVGAWSAHAQSAKGVYTAKCQMCHGPTGLANTPAGKALGTRAFNSPEVIKMSDVDLVEAIKKGKGKMPSFSGKISDADINGLVPVIRGFQR